MLDDDDDDDDHDDDDDDCRLPRLQNNRTSSSRNTSYVRPAAACSTTARRIAEGDASGFGGAGNDKQPRNVRRSERLLLLEGVLPVCGGGRE
jgi:hypothetical protein